MDRAFLDANVLFSAAYTESTGLRQLWEHPDVTLCTSGYAAAEARRNLPGAAAQKRLEQLLQGVTVHPEPPPGACLPPDVHLPDKDTPIVLAAIHVGATHLLTGDVRHFGGLFGHTIRGVLVLRPATYLRGLRPTAVDD